MFVAFIDVKSEFDKSTFKSVLPLISTEVKSQLSKIVFEKLQLFNIELPKLQLIKVEPEIFALYML